MKKVEILMSTYNGEKYIREQIDSIMRQTIPVHLMVRDDGSKDNTISILNGLENITVIEGKNLGATNSFLALIENAPDSDYYAFADQDDVWDLDKMEIAINTIEKYSQIPAIYSCNTRFVDANLCHIKNEELKPICTLGSAIVKNYATGCTIVFNRKLMGYLKKYTPNNIPFHDWWVNLVCLSVGGKSIYDTEPHISYRQHGGNVVGGNDNFIKKWKHRIKKFKKPYHREDMAKQLIEAYRLDINKNNLLILTDVSKKKYNKRLKTGNIVDDVLFRVCLILNKI